MPILDYKAFHLNEDVFSMQIRKFLKRVGITSQREIEQAVRAAIAAESLPADGHVQVQMQLTIAGLDVVVQFDDTLDLE